MVSRMSQLREKAKSWLSKNKKDSDLETGNGRYDFRGSVEGYTSRLWNAFKDKGRLGRILQSRPRTKKAEDVQRAREEKVKRDNKIIALTRQPGLELINKWFEDIEHSAYQSLRSPDERVDSISVEYHVAYYSGILYVIDQFRSIFTSADARKLLRQKKAAEEKEKNASTAK